MITADSILPIIVTVYHSTEPNLFGRLDFAQSLWRRGGFRKVAEVNFNKLHPAYSDLREPESQLNLAFQLTNTIHQRWIENEGVTPFNLRHYEGCSICPRSTSIGDVLEVNDYHYMVAPTGFIPLFPE